MSGILVECVFASTLPPEVKAVAAAIATFARADGALVFPKRGTVASMVGRSERTVQRAITELRRRQVLVPVKPGRPGQVTVYRWQSEGLRNQRNLFDSRTKARNPHKRAKKR